MRVRKSRTVEDERERGLTPAQYQGVVVARRTLRRAGGGVALEDGTGVTGWNDARTETRWRNMPIVEWEDGAGAAPGPGGRRVGRRAVLPLVTWIDDGEEVGDFWEYDESGRGVRPVRWPLMRTDEFWRAGGGGGSGRRVAPRQPQHELHLHKCPGTRNYGKHAGTPCEAIAGTKTNHIGVGYCYRHGGNHGGGKAEGAWIMAHAFAQELNVTPWEALLKAVRIAAGKLAYAQQKIGEAQHDLELEGRVVRSDDGILLDPDTGEPLGVGGFKDLSFWVAQADRWHERLMRCAKLAIDSGVAEKLVENQTLQVTLLVRTVEAALGALALEPGQERLARAAMRNELMRIEAERQAVLDGEVVGELVGPAAEQV